MSQWEGMLTDLELDHRKLNHENVNAKDYKIKEYEVALKHRDTEAIVKLTDDGMIDIFASGELGLRVDPNTNSFNLFGNTVNLMATNLNMKTGAYGLTWNGKAFNPNANEDGQLFLNHQHKVKYSDGMVDIMKKLGLPVEGVN